MAAPTAWRRIASLLLAAALGLAGIAARAQVHVVVPSLDAPAGVPVMLPGFWFEASPIASDTAPAVVLLHGCGGPYVSPRQDPKVLGTRMVEYARLFNGLGIHVLVIDSLTPRDEKELCTQKTASRRVKQRERRRDALGALRWLAEHHGVDASHLGIVGWSNGGATVLAATDAHQAEVATETVRPAMAVAFYPGCGSALKGGYVADSPLLVLAGEADDWTPFQPCAELARRERAGLPGAQGAPGASIELVGYPGAYHDFDGYAPLRLRKDVPNGARPGQGVHAGADPQARKDARERLAAFAKAHLLDR